MAEEIKIDDSNVNQEETGMADDSLDEKLAAYQRMIDNFKENKSIQAKIHEDAELSISDSKAVFGVTSDMVVGDGLSTYSMTDLEPGRLKFSYFNGSENASSGMSFMDFSNNVDSGIANSMFDNPDGRPLPGSVKIEGIYNNHPFHMILDFNTEHVTRGYFYGFLEDLQTACANGSGKEFLNNPALNFGFYDDASVKDVDPNGFLAFMALSAKLSVAEDRAKSQLDMDCDVSAATQRNWGVLLESIESARKNISSTQKPADIFSESGLSNVDIDYGDRHVDVFDLVAKADKAKELVSQKQTDFIVRNFDKLSPAYQKYFNNLTEEQDKNLSFNVASDAIRGMVAREKLKNYLPKFDNRWKTMDTREAEALALEFKGKPTLQQQRFLARYVPEADLEKLDFVKAKAAMGASKATDKLIAMAVSFADIKDKASLTCDQAVAIVNAGVQKLKSCVFSSVSPFVARHVAKFKDDVKEHIADYTMAQWQKDCQTVPPFESQRAFIDWHKLNGDIKDFSKSYSEKFPENSCALYSKRIRDYVQYRDELANSPASQKQREYLKSKGIIIDNNTSQKEALKYIVSSLYDDGIINKNIAQYMAKNPEICSNRLLSSVIESKDFSKDERKELNKELGVACSNFDKFKRTYEIHESLNRPAYSLSDVAKQAAAQHYEAAKTFDDADKEIAKYLSVLTLMKLIKTDILSSWLKMLQNVSAKVLVRFLELKSLLMLLPVLYHRILTIKNLWKRILSLLTMLKKVLITNLPKLKSKLKANLKVRKILKEKQNQSMLSVIDYCYFHYLTFINQIHLINSYYVIDSENI